MSKVSCDVNGQKVLNLDFDSFMLHVSLLKLMHHLSIINISSDLLRRTKFKSINGPFRYEDFVRVKIQYTCYSKRKKMKWNILISSLQR